MSWGFDVAEQIVLLLPSFPVKQTDVSSNGWPLDPPPNTLLYLQPHVPPFDLCSQATAHGVDEYKKACRLYRGGLLVGLSFVTCFCLVQNTIKATNQSYRCPINSRCDL
jgi:hypothetical protein